MPAHISGGVYLAAGPASTVAHTGACRLFIMSVSLSYCMHALNGMHATSIQPSKNSDVQKHHVSARMLVALGRGHSIKYAAPIMKLPPSPLPTHTHTHTHTHTQGALSRSAPRCTCVTQGRYCIACICMWIVRFNNSVVYY